MALRTNREHHELINELFKTLDNIFETHVTFDKMSFALEDLVDKRKQASKEYDEVTDWQRYIKNKDRQDYHSQQFPVKEKHDYPASLGGSR